MVVRMAGSELRDCSLASAAARCHGQRRCTSLAISCGDEAALSEPMAATSCPNRGRFRPSQRWREENLEVAHRSNGANNSTRVELPTRQTLGFWVGRDVKQLTRSPSRSQSASEHAAGVTFSTQQHISTCNTEYSIDIAVIVHAGCCLLDAPCTMALVLCLRCSQCCNTQYIVFGNCVGVVTHA